VHARPGPCGTDVVSASKNDTGSSINWRLILVRYPPVISPGPLLFTLLDRSGPLFESRPDIDRMVLALSWRNLHNKENKKAGESDGPTQFGLSNGTFAVPRYSHVFGGLHEECLGECRLPSMGTDGDSDIEMTMVVVGVVA